MKILLISSYLPFPLHSGGQVRLYNLIKQLSQNHDITLICEMRDSQSDEDVLEMKKYCSSVRTVQRKKQWSVQNILISGFSNHSFLFTGHTLSEMQKLVAETLEEKQFDIIHVETSYVMQNIPRTLIPIVLTEHNIEYQVYARYVERAPFFLRPFLSLDVKKLRKEEKKYWQKADRVIAVSQTEKEVINQDNVDVVPNGLDFAKFCFVKKEKEKKDKTILFLGDFKWIQNRDAVSFITKEIWPKVVEKSKANGLSIKLKIVGKHMPETFSSLRSNTIIIDPDNTQKTEDIFASADILLAPIHVGGGTSYKILESLAVGTPVITTALGVVGLQVTPGKDIVTAEKPEQFVHAIFSLLEESKKYTELAENGRKAVETIYSWETITKSLEESYKKALTHRKT